MKRCFVALGLPESTRKALVEVQEGLRRLPASAARRLRPVAAANLHATVKFLGATTDEQVPELVEHLRLVAATARPGEATLRGLDAFPSPARPRAVFAALDVGRDLVIELAAAVETASVELGFAAERRPHVPHVTLARVENARPRGPLTTWIEQAARESIGPIDLTRLILFESELRPGGSVYTPLAVLPLGVA